jgi:excisionase family DNA binding protein
MVEEVLTTEEVCQRYKMKYRHVLQMLKDGRLQGKKIENGNKGSWRIPIEEARRVFVAQTA